MEAKEFDPSEIVEGVIHNPRKIVIYGSIKTGKSVLACSAKDEFVIFTEDSLDAINCRKFSNKPLQSIEQLYSVIEYLATNAKEKGWRRLVVDTIDWMEPLVWNAAAADVGASDINDDNNKQTNFMKGRKYLAPGKWREILAGFDYLRRTAGMDIILVAHEKTVTVSPVDSDKYDRNVPKIDEESSAVIEEWADVIGYYRKEIFVTKETTKDKKGKAIDADKRVLHLSGSNPAFISGNRYGFGDIVVEKEHVSEIMEYLLTGNENIDTVETPTNNEKGKKVK